MRKDMKLIKIISIFVVVLFVSISVYAEEISVGDCQDTGYVYKYAQGGAQIGTSSCSTTPSICKGSVPSATEKSLNVVYVDCKVSSHAGGSNCNWVGTRYVKQKCDDKTITDITGPSGVIYLAKGGNTTFNFTATPADAKVTWSVTPGVISSNANGNKYSITVTGNPGSGNTCKNTVYTVTGKTGNVTKTSTATVCVYCNAWSNWITTNNVYKNRQNTSETGQGCFQFEGEQQVNGGYKYTRYRSRCCGGATPPPSDYGACYGDEKYLSIANNVEWLPAASGNLKYKYSNITKAEDCKKIETPSACTPSNLKPINPVSKEASKCEEEVVLSLETGQVCKESNQFYQINCNEEVAVNFDYGDDQNTNTNRFLYAGQGFEFGINLTKNISCTASFNKDVWLNAYNGAKNKLSKVNSDLNSEKRSSSKDQTAINKLESEKYRLESLINTIKDIAKNYNNYSITNNNLEENIQLSLSYNVNGKKTTSNNTFIKNKVVQEEKVVKQILQSITLGDSGLKVDNYNLNTKSSSGGSPSIVKYTPAKVYINHHDGTIDNNGKVDGGNKIYTDYDIDEGKWKMNIVVDKILNSSVSVTNNKCDIETKKYDLLYRPIDVSNPFINSTYEIGKNWLNSKYSFTNTIKSTTWNEKSLYVIPLTDNQIQSIKESNKNNKDYFPYLGLCDNPSVGVKDNITQYICNHIN